MVTDASDREKRQRKRLKKTCEVEFCSNDKTYRGISDNFSINGLFIGTADLLAPNSVIFIIVYLPDGSVSKLRGRVRRVLNGSDGTVRKSSELVFKSGMGIEILEKDYHYIKFFMSLLTSIKF